VIEFVYDVGCSLVRSLLGLWLGIGETKMSDRHHQMESDCLKSTTCDSGKLLLKEKADPPYTGIGQDGVAWIFIATTPLIIGSLMVWGTVGTPYE